MHPEFIVPFVFQVRNVQVGLGIIWLSQEKNRALNVVVDVHWKSIHHQRNSWTAALIHQANRSSGFNSSAVRVPSFNFLAELLLVMQTAERDEMS